MSQMNGVARQFWNEVHDLRPPAPDDRERRRKPRQKAVRRVLTVTRRPRRQGA